MNKRGGIFGGAGFLVLIVAVGIVYWLTAPRPPTPPALNPNSMDKLQQLLKKYPLGASSDAARIGAPVGAASAPAPSFSAGRVTQACESDQAAHAKPQICACLGQESGADPNLTAAWLAEFTGGTPAKEEGPAMAAALMKCENLPTPQ